jgi:hypothetical protein
VRVDRRLDARILDADARARKIVNEAHPAPAVDLDRDARGLHSHGAATFVSTFATRIHGSTVQPGLSLLLRRTREGDSVGVQCRGALQERRLPRMRALKRGQEGCYGGELPSIASRRARFEPFPDAFRGADSSEIVHVDPCDVQSFRFCAAGNPVRQGLRHVHNGERRKLHGALARNGGTPQPPRWDPATPIDPAESLPTGRG